MSIAKEQIRQIILQNDINSVTDVYTLLRDSFKDILQELMEAELDASLGLVNSNWRFPGTAMVSLNLNWSRNTSVASLE